MSTRTIELRCPVGPRRLLSKILVAGDRPRVVEGNLVELSCDDCKRSQRRMGMQVAYVLHRFDLAGELIESIVVE